MDLYLQNVNIYMAIYLFDQTEEETFIERWEARRLAWGREGKKKKEYLGGIKKYFIEVKKYFSP